MMWKINLYNFYCIVCVCVPFVILTDVCIQAEKSRFGTLGIVLIMKFDDILADIGGSGSYQLRVYIFAVLPTIFHAIQLFSSLFIFGDQKQICSLEGTAWMLDYGNNSDVLLNSTYIVGNVTVTTLQCELEIRSLINNETKRETCSSWHYDTSVYTSTAVADFNLVCDRKIDITHATMGFFGGCLTAAVVIGTLGDILGRKPTAFICNVITFFASLALIWSPNITVFSILRYFIGLGVFGYFTVFHHSLLPESARWLLSKEALQIVKKIAKENKKVLKTDLIELEINEESVGFKDAIVLVLRSRALVLRWMVLTFSWFAVAVTYYGITYNVGRIGGSIYVNYLISIIMEAIGYSLVLFLSNFFGRKKVHCGSFLIAGCACLASIVTLYIDQSHYWIMILLSNIGKCCVSAGFGNIFLYTTELFPTNVRSFVLGTANIGARLGTIVAPYIANLTDIVDTDFGLALPLIIFGCIALTVGIASLIIPETLNTKLPETIEDAIQMKKYEQEVIVKGENIQFLEVDGQSKSIT